MLFSDFKIQQDLALGFHFIDRNSSQIRTGIPWKMNYNISF